MDLPTPKQIKAIAAACRKAGVTRFKMGELELTLGQPTSTQIYAKKPNVSNGLLSDPGTIESDALTSDDLLYWSVGLTEEITGPETQ